MESKAPFKPASRLQFSYALNNRPRSGYVIKGHQIAQSHVVDAIEAAQASEWLEGRRYNQGPAGICPAKRFYPQTIAGGKNGSLVTVQNDESKHPVEVMNYVRAPKTKPFENN